MAAKRTVAIFANYAATEKTLFAMYLAAHIIRRYRYLKQYGGLDYLREHWWVLHTDNPFWAVRDNRDPKSPIPTHDYDIVEGPVANDDVNNRIGDYLEGMVSKTDFLTVLCQLFSSIVSSWRQESS